MTSTLGSADDSPDPHNQDEDEALALPNISVRFVRTNRMGREPPLNQHLMCGRVGSGAAPLHPVIFGLVPRGVVRECASDGESWRKKSPIDVCVTSWRVSVLSSPFWRALAQ